MEINSDIELLLPNIKNMKEYKSTNNSCAPGMTFNQTCLSLEDLIMFAKIYNKINQPEDVIPLQKEHNMMDDELFRKAYKNWLLNTLQTKFPKAKDESYWIDALNQFRHVLDANDNETLDELSTNRWRPRGPQKMDEWLSNFQINDIVCQYYNVYDDFIFYGAIPLDGFIIGYSLPPQTIKMLNDRGIKTDDSVAIKSLNIQKLYNKGITKIFVVFNLDRHTGSGSHWVSMVIDIKKAEGYFSDSYGSDPENLIVEFAKYMGEQIKKITGKEMTLFINSVRQQYLGTECGVFATRFGLSLIAGKKFKELSRDGKPDDEIQLCRLRYFSGIKHKTNKKLDYCEI